MRLAQLMRERADSRSNAKLGKAIEVSREKVRRWVNGEDLPDAAELVKLADHFEVGVEYLLGRTNDRKSTGPAPLTPDQRVLLQYADMFPAIGQAIALLAVEVSRAPDEHAPPAKVTVRPGMPEAKPVKRSGLK